MQKKVFYEKPRARFRADDAAFAEKFGGLEAAPYVRRRGPVRVTPNAERRV